jgi:hypothetical protein
VGHLYYSFRWNICIIIFFRWNAYIIIHSCGSPICMICSDETLICMIRSGETVEYLYYNSFWCNTSRKRAADRWSLRYFLPRNSFFMVGKSQKSHGCEIWIEFCVRLGKSGSVEPPLEHLPYSPDLTPCDFWAFPTMKRELWGKKFRSHQRSAARFQEVGGAL